MTKQKNTQQTSKFLLITINAILYFFCLGLKAQTVTVGSGTNTNTYLPLNSWYGNNYSQTIYLNSDLTAAGATGASYIRSISYYYASASSPESTWNNWTLYMKNSSKTLFSDGNNWETGLTQVFSGNVSISGAGQWINVTLDRPFLWDGSSNLIVSLYENAPSYSSPQAGFNASTVGNSTDIRSILYYTDGPINTTSLSTANYTANVIPDAMFELVPFTLCSGTPFVSNTISTKSIVCPNIGFDLSLANDNNNISGGITYQWQSSLDSSVWNDMGLAQSYGFYSIPNITSTTFYRCIVTCTNSTLSDTSVATKVIANPFYNCYCLPETSGCFSGDAFNNVYIGSSFFDTGISCSSSAGGYEDRTYIDTVNATAGKYLKFISDVQNGANGSGVVGAWIDYDRNGLFDDSEYKKLYDVNGAGIYNDSLLIPFTVTSGLTKIRLKLEASWGAITQHNSCTSPYYYGQTLDYLVNISAAPTCAGTPNAGSAISTQTLVCTNTPITLNLFGNEETSGITYQWEKSTDATTWTPIGTVQYSVPLTVSSQNETTYYRCSLTCSAGGTLSVSNPVSVSQIPFINCYCTPSPISCSSTSLSTFSFANLSDSPTCEANGYTDNTAASIINLSAGQTYSISGVIDNTWGNDAVLGFWIDYNHNSLFDFSEYRTVGSVTTGSVSNSIKIPNYATGGNTKMRVLLEGYYSFPPSPESCNPNGNGNGQYIDYLVSITPLPSCSGAPNAGDATSDISSVCYFSKINLSLTNYTKTDNSIYQWQYSTDNTNWFDIGNAMNDPEFGVTSQTIATKYRCVVSCPTSSLSSISTPVTVNQNIKTDCYCIPDPMNCSTGAEFTTVNLLNISNTSTCNASNGYSDFTSSAGTVTLTAGETYTFTTTMGSDYGLNVYAWIDFNKTGYFDNSEYFELNYSNSSFDITHTLTIPTSVDTGLTRLRLRTIRYSSLNYDQACFTPIGGGDKSPTGPSITEGETEDYYVFIAPPNCSLVNPPPSISATVNNDSICSGSQIILDVTPGMPVADGFTYIWKSSTDGTNYSNIGSPITSSSLSLNPTFANYFKCEVQCNSNSMLTSDSVQVVVSSMTSLVNSTNVSCNGLTDGSATITVSGGFTPHTYTWTSGSNTSIASNLAAGQYTCTYSDFIGCTNTKTVMILEPTSLSSSILSSSNVSCFGLSDGSASAIATGGTPSYNYVWIPGNISSPNLISASAGDYTCTVTDGNSCISSLTLTITEPTALSATASQTDVTCYGGNNGVASVTANGGTIPYSYFWSNGFGSLPGNTISGGVFAQTYTCTITDANNCSLDQTVTVNQPSLITGTITGLSTLCENTSTSYTINTSNTAGGITSYTWYAGSTAQTSNNSTFDYTAAVVGTETITASITDGNGCSATSADFLVNVSSSKNISGSVLTGTPSVPVDGTVILYKYEPFLTKFDTVEIVSIDAFGSYAFSPVTEGIHIVKAVPTNTNNLQITYGTSSPNWKTADIINHGCNVPSIQNINVLSFATFTPGPGVLSGKIIQDDGYNKRPGNTFRPSAPGGPIGGVIVKGGKNPGGQMLTQTISSGTDGTYTLTGLPLNEELFVLVDLPGLDTSSTYHKVLTIGTSTIVNLDFEVDSMYIKPLADAVGINDLNAKLHEIKVFPNPANDVLNINFKLSQNSLVKIEMLNVIGQNIKTILPTSEQSIDEHRVIIKTTNIPSGMYFIKITINDHESTIKLIVESRE